MKNLIDSVIFLFITHPYDVGDMVFVQGEWNETLIVQEFGLTCSVFRNIYGREISAPNSRVTNFSLYNGF